ncbi:MAG: molybdopterin-synthase adenylyltransferase MoeB [Thiotrichales bacterium]|jgi:adenylyltransferase/sulfurtransferase|nr:molybdopterin-synthase adenylyltransferase MoeB [Thiotrichales bacterium]MBT5984683.1 molybdopterin-synthase adenylyltransferase MoeB [Thiotrichales bacterium]MBT7150642.1 molybdopterin-synthase adenylyltransferase MoeB [Thiotrichales bacterium]MBT7438859.1 molybdopterin-synthase adenylyltransferase MoeB [Thiotrichales bacterium]MBT7933211.1 molybdopterin-synthase adenylyltransferase MoeB [Thiotrichales bacterium]
MEDQELLRYSKQIMLPQIDIEGQQKIMDSTILIIGMGGLGSPTALYLAAAGVGHLIIADFDQVELSNLQRQIIHQTKDIGDDKVNSAKNKLTELNPNIKITIANEIIHTGNLPELIKGVDIVLDGTDNFDSRFEINQICVEHQKPLVSAAVVRFEGQVSVFKGYEKDLPCYQCLYSVDGEENESCIDNGVLAPVAGLVGTIQALQAIKVILNLGDQLCGSLLLVDALDLSFRKVKIGKDLKCPVCNLN